MNGGCRAAARAVASVRRTVSVPVSLSLSLSLSLSEQRGPGSAHGWPSSEDGLGDKRPSPCSV